MRFVHFALVGSLVIDALIAGGYFYGRVAQQKEEVVTTNSTLRELALTPEQFGQLREMRRNLRADLSRLREEFRPVYLAAIDTIRAAQPGEDAAIAQALHKAASERAKQNLAIARHLVEFREKLRPEQRAIINLHLDQWTFVQRLIGLPPPSQRDADRPEQARGRRNEQPRRATSGAQVVPISAVAASRVAPPVEP
jgi:hypothetical protein